jgi:transposase
MFEERQKLYIVNGKSDMRKGIDGLVGIIAEQSELNVFDKEAVFLFCGGKKDRYKALTWESDGFMLCYKRIESGRLQWPKEKEERIEKLSSQQLRWLLEGLSIVQPRMVEAAIVGHVI